MAVQFGLDWKNAQDVVKKFMAELGTLKGVNTKSTLKVLFILTSTYYKLNPLLTNWGSLVILLNLSLKKGNIAR